MTQNYANVRVASFAAMAKGGAGSGAPAPSRDAVSVVARFRPLNKIELSRGGKCSTTLTDEMVTLTTTDGGVHTFGFDKVSELHVQTAPP